MTFPIDPIRRTTASRRAKTERANDADRNLPVPVGEAEDVTPPPSPAPKTAAAFDAHVLGQDGQRRGLRGGPPVLNSAKTAYNTAEWSGPADRRAPKGGITKTKI
jgi:hypothetical protein